MYSFHGFGFLAPTGSSLHPPKELLVPIIAYYFQQMNIPQIAAQRGVNKSTVSRTLRRAEEKIRRYLRY